MFQQRAFTTTSCPHRCVKYQAGLQYADNPTLAVLFYSPLDIAWEGYYTYGCLFFHFGFKPRKRWELVTSCLLALWNYHKLRLNVFGLSDGCEAAAWLDRYVTHALRPSCCLRGNASPKWTYSCWSRGTEDLSIYLLSTSWRTQLWQLWQLCSS